MKRKPRPPPIKSPTLGEVNGGLLLGLVFILIDSSEMAIGLFVGAVVFGAVCWLAAGFLAAVVVFLRGGR